MSVQQNVTIKDLARILKISVSTVSRALRGGTEIKAETRALVLGLARELNYTPNPIALSLKTKSSKVLGVIVPEIANTFCSSTISGIEEVAYSRGYHVTIFQSHEKYDREVIHSRLVGSRRMDGLIIAISNETTDVTHLAELRDRGIPVVMIDRVLPGLKTPKVIVDDTKGAFMATEHLLHEGYRKIAHLTISKELSITRNRLNGFRQALSENGVTCYENWIHHCSFEHSDIDAAITSLFSGADRPDAILASAERILMRCYAVLQNMHINIPEECALIGFSDNPLNRFLNPSLSAVRQPTLEIGRRSANMLIDLIENETEAEDDTVIELETTLDLLASSGKSSLLTRKPELFASSQKT